MFRSQCGAPSRRATRRRVERPSPLSPSTPPGGRLHRPRTARPAGNSPCAALARSAKPCTRRRRGESIRVEQDQPCGLNFYSRRAAAPSQLGVIDMGELRRRRKGGHGLLKLLDQKLDTSGLGGKTCERTARPLLPLANGMTPSGPRMMAATAMLSILGDRHAHALAF
jgi:hypothetical protein